MFWSILVFLCSFSWLLLGGSSLLDPPSVESSKRWMSIVVFFSDQSLSNSWQSTGSLVKRIFIEEVEHSDCISKWVFMLVTEALVGCWSIEDGTSLIYYRMLPSGMISTRTSYSQGSVVWFRDRCVDGLMQYPNHFMFSYGLCLKRNVAKFGTHLAVANLGFSRLYSKLYSALCCNLYFI